MKSDRKKNQVRFIDLFAGMGGFRVGFEEAARLVGLDPVCVYTSEIKPSAVRFYSDNFETIQPDDITVRDPKDIPHFSVLLAGFPCQAFSSAGKREGFLDTRGTLFFDIERVLAHHRPDAFILENVEGLVNHDRRSKHDPIGQTLNTILFSLQQLDYKVTWKVLDASDFGLAQQRRRIFIVGTKQHKVSLEGFEVKKSTLAEILEHGIPLETSKTIDLILKHYSLDQLPGKSLKDKRGGSNNIHSWDIELRGKTTKAQKQLLGELLKARRNKKWGERKQIAWMDGMPLTLEEIRTFFDHPRLQVMLEDLVDKGYLSFEHPKDLKSVLDGKTNRVVRVEREDLPKGFNIVAGKLSFEISKILDPNGVTPTLVATDLDRMMVIDGNGLRRLTIVEMLRLFGFQDSMQVNLRRNEMVDLLGNSVPVNIVQSVATRVLAIVTNRTSFENYIENRPQATQETLFS